jgi:hypothetical protein
MIKSLNMYQSKQMKVSAWALSASAALHGLRFICGITRQQPHRFVNHASKMRCFLMNHKLIAALLLSLSLPCFSQSSFMGLDIEPEQSSETYQRSEYGGWIDADRDGESTRVEVLKHEAVADGVWLGAYTGRIFFNSRGLDIDHLVPLAEAHRSGGHAWSDDKKKAYANDLSNTEHLIAVSASANRSKGSRDPAKWMPPNRAYWCEYLTNWVLVKINYSLSIDQDEHSALVKGFAVCESYSISDSIN